MKSRRITRRTLWDSRDGSVNVFLTGITAALFFCVAVLIDFARIAAFERMAESAVYSGVRSALSAYDAALYERYGLFAKGGTDGGEIFGRVVSASLAPESPDRGLRLLRTDMSAAEVLPGDTLGLHAVLERQILEEMKYKAPIDFTLELAERFGGLSVGLREAAHTADTMKRLTELFDSRQRHLEEALRLQQAAAEAVAASGLAGRIPYPSGTGMGTNAADVAAGYGRYVGWVRAEAERDAKEAAWRRQAEEALRRWEDACRSLLSDQDGDGEDGCGSPPEIPKPYLGPSYAAEIAAYERSARETAADLVEAARSAAETHAGLMAAARQAVEAAEEVNERMAAMLRSARQGGTGPTSAGGGTPGGIGEIRSILEDASRLVLDAGWFDAYRRELDAQDAGAAAVLPPAGRFDSAVAEALGDADRRNGPALESAADGLFRAYQAYASPYLGPDGAGSGGIIAERSRIIADLASGDGRRKEFERQSEAKRGEAARLLRKIARLGFDEEAEKEFERLRKRYEASLALNKAPASDGGGPGAGDLDGDSGEYAGKAADQAAGLFGALDEAAVNLRDEVYLNEYAVARFSHFVPRQLAGLIGQDSEKADGTEGGAAGGTADLAADRAADVTEEGTAGGAGDPLLNVAVQEAEYILYGYHHPAGNIAAAYAEIFAVRAAIRLMEGLVECRGLGHPLVVFAAAVAYSLERALGDMLELIRTGKTELSKWARIDVAYRDYLRLFLLIHGSKSEKLARISALIEHDTGYRLAGMPVALTGRADVSVNLWFLPGVMRLIAAGGILEGKVEGGRYETTVVAGSSY